MENIIIRFNNEKEIDKIVKLNEMFAKENCCNGIIADDYSYFKNRKVAVAVLENKIVGYCYGTIETQDKDRSYSSKGDKVFCLEEMYITKEYRSCNIGKQLFEFVERYAKDNGCKSLSVSAVSKDYKRLLSFYIDKLGMSFQSAFLTKNI